jgi:hypothetical protein
MRLSTLVMSAVALAAISVTAPAAAASAATQSTVAQPVRAMAPMGDQGGDDDAAGVNGLNGDSPVCSALGAETIPQDDDVAKCLLGTRLI